MNPIGVMQGRLSPPVGDRIQAFPLHTWHEEFGRARTAGFAGLEWIYEAAAEGENPLRTDDGLGEILRLADASGVSVWSVCADYYMSTRLVTPTGAVHGAMVDHLVWLVSQVRRLGARYIILPFVDDSSLRSRRELDGLREVIRAVLPWVEHAGVALHLETDLDPADLGALLEAISHPLVRVTYDMGNSAALGRDPIAELAVLGPWLGSVHVKDRLRGGPTVPLGTGAVDFPTCFRLICTAGYRGVFILQAARQDGMSEVECCVRNREFVEQQLAVVTSQMRS